MISSGVFLFGHGEEARLTAQPLDKFDMEGTLAKPPPRAGSGLSSADNLESGLLLELAVSLCRSREATLLVETSSLALWRRGRRACGTPARNEEARRLGFVTAFSSMSGGNESQLD